MEGNPLRPPVAEARECRVGTKREVRVADARELLVQFTEAFNAHDEEAIRSFYADNSVLEAPGDVRLEGPDQIVQFAMGWLNAFPDATVTVHNEVVAGEWVAHQFTFSGTHKETLMSPAGEIPATNRSVEGRGAELFRVQGGKVVEDHLYFDQVQLLTQLGLMPETTTA